METKTAPLGLIARSTNTNVNTFRKYILLVKIYCTSCYHSFDFFSFDTKYKLAEFLLLHSVDNL